MTIRSFTSGDSVTSVHSRRSFRARLSRVVAAAVAGLLLANCSSDGPGAPSNNAAVASVVVSGLPTENVVLAGTAVQLTAQPRSAGGDALERAVTWSSSNTDVAAVSATGLLSGVVPGPATITATSEGVSTSVDVSVRSPIPVPPATASSPVTTTVLGGAVTLTVPPGATSTTTSLTVAPSAAILSDDRVLAGSTFDFGPEGTVFSTPITLVLAYDPALVPAADREKLRIHLVEDNGTLTELPGTVNLTEHTVSASVDHFSTYTIVAPAPPTQVSVAAGDAQSVPVGELVPVAPAVLVRDAQNRPVPRADVIFAVSSGGGRLIGASAVETDAAGIATLAADWELGDTPGENTLTATVVGTALTQVFTATATAPATQLVVTAAPSAATSGVAFATDLSVAIQTDFGTTVGTSTAAVSASLVGAGGTLVGTASVNAVSGVATFSGLRIDGAGSFRIAVAAAGLTPDTTAEITVTQVAAALVLTTEPAGAESGSPFTTQPVVEVRDNAGLVITTAVGSITASKATGSGTLYGTLSADLVNGVATFVDMAIDGSGEHSVTFALAGGPSVTSAPFDVAPTDVGIRLLVAATPETTVAAAGTLEVPILLDMSNRGAADLASITVEISWDPARFSFVSETAGSWQDDEGGNATVIVNSADAATGLLRVTGFTTDATTSSFTLRNITLTALATGVSVDTDISANVSTAGNAAGSAIVVTPRPLTVTVTP